MNYETRTIEADSRLALPGEGRSGRRRWIVAAIIVAVALGIAWFAFGSTGEEAAKGPAAGPAEQLPTVTVVRPGRDTVSQVVTGIGSLAARRDMPVGVAGEGGEVRAVLVDAGDWVRKGQVLAIVDRSVQTQTAESLEAQIRVARADAELAEAELQRAKQLVDRGFVSQADVQRRTATRDAARARVRVAEAQLAEARARNARLNIRAPEAGLVLSRNVEPGQIVGAGSGVLFRIAMNGQMEMRAQLSEEDLAKVRVGVPATVTPVGSSEAFKGQVWQVSPTIDPQTRQGIARILLPYHPALRPGGFANARIMVGANQAPLLPESAVLSDQQGNYVYILDDQNRAVRRAVKIGEVSDAGVSIASGLDGSERVVLSAGGFLNPGQKVIPNLQTLKR